MFSSYFIVFMDTVNPFLDREWKPETLEETHKDTENMICIFENLNKYFII